MTILQPAKGVIAQQFVDDKAPHNWMMTEVQNRANKKSLRMTSLTIGCRSLLHKSDIDACCPD